ncbi:unnamed protein product [Heligmosomoides polygyrus]|uniref:DNA-directed DNA polymerase n=1 Tax=Heligmosomoides polygyrus TaxID=6339 RepID=A0A183GAY7_HELPZ|nr:unnamed protein product [Heligmosomoides polygyrus]
MRIGDLKRAVEDVILRPDQNTLNDIDKRDTIAALDLCQEHSTKPGAVYVSNRTPPSVVTQATSMHNRRAVRG